MNPSPDQSHATALRQAAEARLQTRTELALGQSEEQYHQLFEHMMGGCIVVEVLCDAKTEPVDHRLLQANAGFDEITGLKRSEEIGKTSAQLSFKFFGSWLPGKNQNY